MEQINYEQLIPAQPEEDVVAFAIDRGAFQGNYLIYKSDRVYDPLEDRVRDMVQVACSACGEQFYAEKIQAGGCTSLLRPGGRRGLPPEAGTGSSHRRRPPPRRRRAACCPRGPSPPSCRSRGKRCDSR